MNSPDALGLTPLHHAAANGHLETLTTLVRAGAIVDAPNTQGRTALHLAAMAEKDMSNTVKSLVSHGANVEARDLYAQTPLHWACDRGHQNSIAALLEAKSDANSAGNNGDTPLGIAVTFGRSMDILQLLLRFGASVSQGNNNRLNTASLGFKSLLFAPTIGHKCHCYVDPKGI